MNEPRNEREAHAEMDWSAHTRDREGEGRFQEYLDLLDGAGRPGSEEWEGLTPQVPIWRDLDWWIGGIALVILVVLVVTQLGGCGGGAASNPFETTLPVNCAATQGVCK